MRTEISSQMVAAPGVGVDAVDRKESSSMWGEARTQKGVVAVVVERDDGTCVTFGRACAGVWPSVDEAKNVVEKFSSPVLWRETTGGVWVARVDGAVHPVPDPGPARRRRSDADRPTRAPAGTDTYMAARVLRGTAPVGPSGNLPHGSAAGSGVDSGRLAG